ncbi:GDSL esterase/lipase At5g03610-like [Gastrolobium bilobum]|uniref:GDSL esterase/lipase At5g03610-like n=1 Tax=Gastrolobium bilobum TaxID=150636 RepID=UPI002AB00A79|nr:GDSL esterase/lipase At5g03610-like [Gastrolobium bilobum]
MVKQTPTVVNLLPLILLLFFVLTITEVEGAKKSYGVYNKSNNSVKLFVFGDSYVDTGNFVKGGSYKPPSGITFPGKPAGRFSDGRVLTDYVASFLKVESPTPYALRNSSEVEYGMNFAYGGTGIFDTLVDGPNMTVQIDSFEKLIQQNVYTKLDLASSVALVNAAGNDYTTFVLKKKDITHIKAFTESLIEQTSINLKRIHSLGINKVAVGLLQPIGCLPALTVISFHETCLDILNLVSQTHNQMLLQNVLQLNHQMGKSVFVTLDLYNSFLSTIATMKKKRAENSTLMNPLKQCCDGDSLKYSCGSVDDKGEKKYSVCGKPELSFFWDNVHPSQNGWDEVSMLLQSSLGQLTGKNF